MKPTKKKDSNMKIEIFANNFESICTVSFGTIFPKFRKNFRSIIKRNTSLKTSKFHVWHILKYNFHKH